MSFDRQDFPITAGIRASCHMSCHVCPARGNCVVKGLPASELSRWNSALLAHVPLTQAGKSLFATGEPATAVFVVRAGCIKSYTVDEDGKERVRSFHLPGDVIGLDCFGASHYPSGAVALVPSQVCRVSRRQLQSLLSGNPELTQHLFERTSRDLRLALALGGDYTAEQRMAAFLLYMQERTAPAAGRVMDTSIKLPMTRRDIANYLRLATETVCRVLTRFEQKGWLKNTDKTLRLNAPMALWALAEPVAISQRA